MPRSQLPFALLGSLIATSIAHGGDDPLTLREVYWQVLPVQRAYVDSTGRPWFPTAKGDVAARGGLDTGQLAPDQVLLLGDKSGRIWLNSRYRGDQPIRYFDGKTWHQTAIIARVAFEDSSGRVFLANGTDVHVFDNGAWSKQRVAGAEPIAEGHFVEDSAGRVWFWASDFDGGHWGEHPGTRGLWCHAGGKWTNYSRDSGLTIENVEVLIPLPDDRFFLLGGLDEKSHQRPYALWSPSRRLADAEPDFFRPEPVDSVNYAGVDLDGLHHFDVQRGDAKPPHTRVVISSRGEAKTLSTAETERAAQMPVGLYQNNRRIFGRLSEAPPAVPCQPSEAYCADRLGRIYFRYHNRVGVVWPKFEKPGEVVRFSSNPDVRTLFQTRDGRVWGLGTAARTEAARRDDWLMYWDGAAWADTPVKLLPHPRWTARSRPPWAQWSQLPPLFLTSGDTVLAIVIRDIYQDMQAAAKGQELDNWRHALEAGTEVATDRKTHWCEAWLYRDGKWIGPEKLPEFLEKQRAVLAGEYQRPATRGDWLALLADRAGRLWLAYDGVVHVVDKDGAKTWIIPTHFPRLGSYQLCRQPDGRMLLSASGGKAPALWALDIQDGKIAAEKFSEPEWGIDPSQVRPAAMLAHDKSLWLGSGRHVWKLQDGRWEKRDDLAEFLFEDTDGSLWFNPGEEYASGANRGYRVVKGNQTTTFPWPIDYEFAELRPMANGRILAACGYWLVQLVRSDDAMKRTITTPTITDRYLGNATPFVASDGTIFSNASFGK